MPLASMLLAAVLTLTCASSAIAVPSLRYSWDACDQPVPIDKSWAGPGVYTQVLSATGLPSNFTGFGIEIGWGLYIPSAWSFYDGGPCWYVGPACQGASRLTISSTGGNCPDIPGSSLNLFGLYCGITNPRWGLSITGYFDPPFQPDPDTRYTLAVIRYDHRRSAVGSQDPAVACGDVEQGRCFALARAEIWGTGYWTPLYLENDSVRWQDPDNLTNCPASTPARSRTWGQIKSLYR